MSGVELKPCPWCQAEHAEVSDNGRGLIFHVRCRKCRCAGPGERCAADAIAAWNTRAPDQSLLDRIAALEGALRDMVEGDSTFDIDDRYENARQVLDGDRARSILDQKP